MIDFSTWTAVNTVTAVLSVLALVVSLGNYWRDRRTSLKLKFLEDKQKLIVLAGELAIIELNTSALLRQLIILNEKHGSESDVTRKKRRRLEALARQGQKRADDHSRRSELVALASIGRVTQRSLFELKSAHDTLTHWKGLAQAFEATVRTDLDTLHRLIEDQNKNNSAKI